MAPAVRTPLGTPRARSCSLRAMATANLALRFVLELAGVACMAAWGWSLTDQVPLRLFTALLAAGALAVAWALVVAPKARNPVPQDVRMVIGTGLLLLAAAALAASGSPQAALVLAVLVVVNQLLVRVLGRGMMEA